ncbi:MAG: hypothetical protein K6U80_09500 [Firmicutes bacterium]|nr:hypothetical protein [Bacillota bacterium]
MKRRSPRLRIPGCPDSLLFARGGRGGARICGCLLFFMDRAFWEKFKFKKSRDQSNSAEIKIKRKAFFQSGFSAVLANPNQEEDFKGET